MTDQSVTVAEVSSFQLETIMDFHPDVSAILNITPDHLDRHGSMENYIRIKECITMNQTAKDAVVLNYDDPVLREFGESRIEEPEPAEDAADTETEAVAREDGLDGAEDLREPDETAGEEPEQSETEVTETVSESEAEETDPEEVLSGLKARVFWFSSRERLKEGFFLDGDNIVYADGTKEIRRASQIFDMHGYVVYQSGICGTGLWEIVPRDLAGCGYRSGNSDCAGRG